MTRHRHTVHLRHMLDHAREIISVTQSKSRSDLDSDRLLNLALVRLLEIIGEAANRVSKDTQSQYHEIPWSQIVNLRNRLIHGYDVVDFEILWQIIKRDVPALILALEKALSLEGSG